MTSAFWDTQVETIERSELERLQAEQLRRTLESAFNTPLYRYRLASAGIQESGQIRSLDDLRRIPFTTKDDLRSAYPRQLLAVAPENVVRLHTSSGTTGTATVIYHTRSDLESWTDLAARSIIATGATRRDVFQNMMTYGLFTGGLGLHYGAERVGMLVIPVGAGNTRRQIQLMRDFMTTVIHATPSYLLHIQAALAREGVKREELCLSRAFIGAEPHSENTRLKLEELLGIDAYNSYGLSEMNGPGVAFECVYKQGMHVWEDAYILEVIDPDTLEPVPDGEEGELVFTTLRREATPLLRYRTRDISRIEPGTCACGRTHRRIGRIKARTDDMLIINGVNVFPSQIEDVIMKVPEVGTNYQILVDKQGTLDRITVKTEINSRLFGGEIDALELLKKRIGDRIKAEVLVNPRIELHEPGGLPVYEGKAKRVIDQRPAF